MLLCNAGSAYIGAEAVVLNGGADDEGACTMLIHVLLLGMAARVLGKPCNAHLDEVVVSLFVGC